MKPNEVYELILKRISAIKKNKPIRIAINGIEGSGKTTFAEHLTRFLISRNHKAIHVSIDGFHHDRMHRYRQGKDSALGYYEDSYDEHTFVKKVLKSSQDEIPNYISASHDLQTDQYLSINPINIPLDAILITDGAYLFKPIYIAHWDLKIYLKTDFETALNRGIHRDRNMLGGEAEAKIHFTNRYHAASRIYIEENQPENTSDVIFDNTVFENLILVK